MRSYTVIALIMAILMVSLIPAGPAAASGDVFVRLDGPTALATGSSQIYTLTISGGPGEEGGNFSYSIGLSGLNTTGASVSPTTGNSTSGSFSLNITAPAIPQTLKVMVNATSHNAAKSVTVEKSFSIIILRPIVISQKIVNTGDVEAKNVLVKFYVDDSFIGSQVVDSIPAKSDATVEYKWLAEHESPGKHEVKVVVDSQNELVELSEGNNVAYHTIYISGGNTIGAVLWAVIGVLIAVLFLLYSMKGKRKKYARKY